MSQTDIVHVPHKASGDARNSVVSGTVQMMFDAVTTMTELAKSGQVRALGTTGLTRSQLTPDLPTIAETVSGYEATIWLGCDGAKGHA
jgi:tripartite-type tricarboxylate transporter receptor subunit TctC